MRKTKILLVLGLFISILPYLGFPYAMKNLLISASGLAVLYVSFMIYMRDREGVKEKQVFENFSENNDFVEVEKELLEVKAE